jgi:TetR/AcrR family transcriptional regulator
VGEPEREEPAVDRRGDGTRERILEAAIRIFAERGYHGATIQMIVHGAKANQAAVNYHFGGKANLYAVVMEAAISRLIHKRDDQLAHWMAQDDPLTALVRDLLSENTLDDGERDRLHRLMTWEHLSPSGVRGSHPGSFMDGHFQAMTGVVAADAGLPEGHPDLSRMTVWVLGQCMVFGRPSPVRQELPAIGSEPGAREAFVEDTTQWLVPRIRAGLALSR